MDFEPKTRIYFLRTGIDDFNKVVCKTEDELFGTLLNRQGNFQGVMENTSFQRADGLFSVRVDHADIPYYKILQCDTVMYNNIDTDGSFWIVGNITSVEWRNPDCSFVFFKVDPFMTYQPFIDWNTSTAFIEREHVKDDWASDGGNPLFSNIGPAEDFGTVADTPFYTWTKTYQPEYVVIQSPYDDSGEPQFDGEFVGGLYTSLSTKVGRAEEANTFFKAIAEKKEASINNIVGVYGIPQVFWYAYNSGTNEATETLEPVNVATNNPNGPGKFNNAKCWSAPFVNIRLMSSEGDVKDFTPQWFGNDISEYTLKFLYTAAGKQFGGAAATFLHKNGSFNWKAWADFTVMIRQLPSCPWTGDGFTDWASVNMTPSVFNTLTGILSRNGGLFNQAASFLGGGNDNSNMLQSGMGLLTGAVDTIVGNANDALQLAASIKQQQASGATVNGTGSSSTLFDIGQDGWGFKVIYYGTQQYIMQSVDAYFDRFGYRVNRLKKINIENRPIWTFIKTAECHITASTGIPFYMERQINAMFNHGVTFWKNDRYNGGRKIGDFSGAEENRGIRGA